MKVSTSTYPTPSTTPHLVTSTFACNFVPAHKQPGSSHFNYLLHCVFPTACLLCVPSLPCLEPIPPKGGNHWVWAIHIVGIIMEMRMRERLPPSSPSLVKSSIPGKISCAPVRGKTVHCLTTIRGRRFFPRPPVVSTRVCLIGLMPHNPNCLTFSKILATGKYFNVQAQLRRRRSQSSEAEVVLALQARGGRWLEHKSRYSSQFSEWAFDAICDLFL